MFHRGLYIPRMTTSQHSFMLNFVLLMLLVGPVACPPTKPQPVDDEQEVDVPDSGEHAEVHNRELSRAFQTNVGQDSSNETYSQLRKTVESRDVNVNGGDKGASNIVGKTTDGSVPRRTIEDRMLTAAKNEMDASERSEWSGWAMAEAPAMFDVRDRKEKHSRNRRRKSTSGNFGPVYRKKSDIAHSTSFGKEVSEDNKGRTLMLLDREADASGAKKTAVETQLWQYIGIRISLAIVLAVCAWICRCSGCSQHCCPQHFWQIYQGVQDINEEQCLNAAAQLCQSIGLCILFVIVHLARTLIGWCCRMCQRLCQYDCHGYETIEGDDLLYNLDEQQSSIAEEDIVEWTAAVCG